VDVASLLVTNTKSAELIEPGEVRSTTHRQRPKPLPCCVLRSAKKGRMPRARKPRRIASAS
jgi:hypothetical protein